MLENEYLGTFVSKFPSMNNVLSLNKIKGYLDKDVSVMCFIKHIKEIKTKHNDDMAFLEVIDQSGNEELIMFSDTYLKYKDYLDFNHLYLINVRISKRNDKMSFIINKVEKVGK